MDVRELARSWAALPQISNVHASADGRWGFWCMAGVAEVEEVFCAPLDGSAPPERLTQGDDHHLIRDVSADGMLLVLAQSRNASEHDRLLLLDRREGNRVIALTPEQDSHYVYGGRLTRDNRAVIFVTDFDYVSSA